MGCLFNVNVGCSTPVLSTGCAYFFPVQLVEWSNLKYLRIVIIIFYQENISNYV